MRCVVPGSRNIRKFSDGGQNHDKCGYCTTQGDSRPGHWRGRRVLQAGCINLRRVKGSVEIVDRDMQNPDTIEVDEEMGNRALFKVCLKKYSIPLDLTKLEEPLGRGYVDQPLLLS